MQPETRQAAPLRAQCQHCGRDDVGSFEAGWGSVNGYPVCHPQTKSRPDCYYLVLLGHHDMPCLECGQPELWDGAED